ncbi:helix-hairpin-helix domain-containing protein [Lysinibacillus sp. KU-BSD001]|uniref:helix-hairpin-helix domain-containing protein n=1 Tax=Lysinibacillus sp. KU-BSD001 TaxID=3141328 RepID=UPI0036EB668B
MLLPSILCVTGIIAFTFLREEEEPSFEFITEVEQEPIEVVAQEIEVEQQPQRILVDVKGAVNYPGVYELTEADRVVDAIKLAGGYVDGANAQLINHAQKLQDEMVIYIPLEGQDTELDMQQFISSASSSSADSSSSGKVNINTADETQLTTLPGIGPAKAKAIIAHRDEHGKFQAIDGLKNVTGIGDKTFEQLKDLIDIK